MKQIHIAILAATVLCSGSAGAAQPPVWEFDSIAALRNNTIDPAITPFAAYVAAYNCDSGSCPPVTPDGGEGLFVANGKCGLQGDGGSIVVDDNGTCWYRQNLNGDLRQFGATLGSQYDCSKSGIDSCSAFDTLLSNAQSAAEKTGIHRLTTSGVQIRLSSIDTFALDDDMTLDGGVAAPDVSNHTISSPGTIWTGDLDPGNPAITLGSHSVLQHISVMPYWLGMFLFNPTGSEPGKNSLTLPEQQDILSQMISHG